LGSFPALAQKPENVLIVVNQSSSVSRQIGEYYKQKRNIPPGNVCLLKTKEEEQVEREVYQQEIANPVAKCLQSRGLTEKILYIVTTLGVPLIVKTPAEKFVVTPAGNEPEEMVAPVPAPPIVREIFSMAEPKQIDWF
jgi:uncharacterized protein (TIGR03790 family)